MSSFDNSVPKSSAEFRPYPVFQSLTGYNRGHFGLPGVSGADYPPLLERAYVQRELHLVAYVVEPGLVRMGSMPGATPYQRAYDPMANYGASKFCIRHMFKGHMAYDLPFGRGPTFVHTSKALDAAIGGWRLFADLIVQTGSPLAPSMATNNSYALSSNAVWYPNGVGNPTAVPGGQNFDSWFNVNAFAAPTPGTFGNMGRNVVYGPKLSAVNTSLSETFSFTERLKLEFSGSASNLLNHPSFALPDRQIGPGHREQITGTSVGSREMELIAKFRF